MTLASELTKIQNAGNSSTTVFPVTFIFWDDADLRVIETVVATGVETVKTIATHYTLTGGSGSTGELTMLVATPTGTTLTIKSNLNDVQSNVFPLGGRFPSTTVEESFDKATRLVQQKEEVIARSVKLAETSATTGLIFPEPAANKAIKWNSGGTNLVNSTADVDTAYAAAAASAAAALVSENAAAADLALTNADVVLTNADVVLTNADVVLTGNDVTSTNADVVLTGNDVTSTNADVVSTNADVGLTNADVGLTNADVVLTNADVVLTNASAAAALVSENAAAADLALTNADVVLTNADVVLTNADVVTTGNLLGAVAMPYVFNATTAMADPTTGLFRLNSATPASVTAIAIDDTTNATGNPDINAFLATWDDSSSTIKGTLQIVQEDTPANFMTFNITALTDNAGWVQLTVAHVAGSTLFGSAKACRLQFIRNGDAGAATDLTAPGPIGSVTASTGDFTTLNSTGGALNGTLGATTASTGAFTTLTSSTSLDIGSTIAITGVLDEDNMSSNSAVKLATQQSIKAYVDSSPSGKCLQMVSVTDSAVATGTTSMPIDDTIPQNTEGTEFMSLAITPISATSKLVIMVNVLYAIANGGIQIAGALFVDSTAGALAASAVNPYYMVNQRAEQFAFNHVVTSGSTSARTYKFRMGPETTDTITFNGETSARRFGGVASSSITIMEIE